MKRVRFAFWLAIAAGFAGRCQADTVYFETAGWNPEKKVRWVGRLDHVDNVGIAYFSYRQGAVAVPFKIHISRILSLTVDAWDSDKHPFPETQQPLDQPLSSDSDKRRTIALRNDDQVARRLSAQLLVTPDRDASIFYLHGEITSITREKLLLWALEANGKRMQLALDRRYFKQWVR